MQVICKIKNWKIDADGFLRIHVKPLKAGVFDYSVDELPDEVKDQFAGKDKIRQYIPADEFTAEALKSLEGKPVVRNAHEWQTPDKREVVDAETVGNVAGSPDVKDGFVECDFIITDPEAIEAIKNKDLVEVSAGYVSTMEVSAGEFEGKPYDAIQRNLSFNHVLLLPEGKGRCGYDVRIYNKNNNGDNTMIIVKIKNSKGQEVSYNFTSEADRTEAEKMVNDIRTQNAEETDVLKKDLSAKTTEATDTKTTLEAQIAVLTTEIAKLTEQIAKLSSDEHQDNELAEREGYKKDEEAVLNAEVAEKDRDATKKDIDEQVKNSTGRKMNARMKVLTVKVMNAKGVDLSKASDEVIKTTFKTLVAFATKNTGTQQRTENQLPIAGQKVENAAGAKHPVFCRKEAPASK
ncbi:MAG TPA: hypothetical protein DDW84_00220 [Phycisphaerales bacterium]|nr:MAG: hypothetical protein A2Y13_01935 [Planctomycetes bacterium GWC2_45_44]HBG77262.1 hypothetical protein [Phycisphaerales bacterium]HBR19181.1 hypothetical protein [Phycisphaerales bacterium]